MVSFGAGLRKRSPEAGHSKISASSVRTPHDDSTPTADLTSRKTRERTPAYDGMGQVGVSRALGPWTRSAALVKTLTTFRSHRDKAPPQDAHRAGRGDAPVATHAALERAPPPRGRAHRVGVLRAELRLQLRHEQPDSVH